MTDTTSSFMRNVIRNREQERIAAALERVAAALERQIERDEAYQALTRHLDQLGLHRSAEGDDVT